MIKAIIWVKELLFEDLKYGIDISMRTLIIVVVLAVLEQGDTRLLGLVGIIGIIWAITPFSDLIREAQSGIKKKKYKTTSR